MKKQTSNEYNLLTELMVLLEAKEEKKEAPPKEEPKEEPKEKAPAKEATRLDDVKPNLDKISIMLFGKKCGPVVDEKRSPEPKFFGVSNARSKLTDSSGKAIKLTFDNSTDSGEFEINSLIPLKIERGGDVDKAIRTLYKKFKVHSKKKVNYLDVDGNMYLREIHLGKYPSNAAVSLVKSALNIISGGGSDEESSEEE